MENANPKNAQQIKLPSSLINGTILIVDDISFYNSLVTQSLSLYGFTGTIVYASSVKEAIEKIRISLDSGKMFDLIISDLHLSDAKGSDLVKHVRLNKVTENIPFILMTTDSEHKSILSALECGIDHYVIKPINADNLFNSIIFSWKKRNN